MKDVTNDPEKFSNSEPLAEIVLNILKSLVAKVPGGMSIFSIDVMRMLKQSDGTVTIKFMPVNTSKKKHTCKSNAGQHCCSVPTSRGAAN